MSARRTKRGSRHGRGWVVVALALVTFVLVGSAVVWRRTLGIAQARELRELSRERQQLLSERAALQGQVRVAASRAHILPVAQQRLGMRIPADTQVVLIQRPSPRATGRQR